MSAFASLKAFPAFCPQARAFFARLATPPSPARAARYDALIRALLAAGVWSKLDALYLLAAADAATALTNLRQSSFGLTAVNAPTFAADQGYTGNGTTQYLDTGFRPDTAGGNYTQDSASVGVWKRTHGTGANKSAPGWPGMYVPGNPQQASYRAFDKAIGDEYSTRINDTNSSVGSITYQQDTGWLTLSRTSSTAVAGYFNGALDYSHSNASVGLPNRNLWIMGDYASELANHQLSAACIGAGLDATENLALYNAVYAYLQGIGAVA